MTITILIGDCRRVLADLPAESVHCVVTSPPFWGLRDYHGGDAEIGREPAPDEFVAALVDVFREVRRVLRADGTVWLNLGTSYAGSLVLRDDESFALRDDLTPDETRYVLSVLATRPHESGEIALPDLSVGVDEAIASLADGEEV